jgi:hypothetical protein
VTVDPLVQPEPEPAPPAEPESPITALLGPIDAMVLGVLRNATLRALLRPESKTPLSVTAERAALLLLPYQDALQADLGVIREGLRRAYLHGVEQVHERLHGQPGVDNEMLDQAIEFHSYPPGESEAVEP